VAPSATSNAPITESHPTTISTRSEPSAGQAAQTSPPRACWNFLDPRNAIRLASLYLMKDRAGTVGANGAAALLRGLLQEPGAAACHRSFIRMQGGYVGARRGSETWPESQVGTVAGTAISYLSFAETVPGRDGPGGLSSRTRARRDSIFSTYSASDFPLHAIYHLALLRRKDIGEAQIAAHERRPAIRQTYMPPWAAMAPATAMNH